MRTEAMMIDSVIRDSQSIPESMTRYGYMAYYAYNIKLYIM